MVGNTVNISLEAGEIRTQGLGSHFLPPFLIIPSHLLPRPLRSLHGVCFHSTHKHRSKLITFDLERSTNSLTQNLCATDTPVHLPERACKLFFAPTFHTHNLLNFTLLLSRSFWMSVLLFSSVGCGYYRVL